MNHLLDEHWKRGQEFETVNDLAAVRAEYSALLAINGRHIPARLRMSRFEQFQGNYGRAHHHALQAADAARFGGSSRHLVFVTLRLLDFSEDAEIASVILSADPSDPEVLKQSPALAQHLWLAGRYEDALRFLDSVSGLLAPHPLLLFTRANVLRYLGRISEAADLYEQSLVLRPDFADAHWAISTNSRAVPPEARIPRLKAAFERVQDNSMEQAHLYHALFRELDAAGETAAAWESLMHGARIMHARVPHDAHQASQRLDALMSTDWLPPAGAISSNVQPLPVFVVGLPRTGTTLLDRMLGNHGWVKSIGERNDFAAAVSQASNRFFQNLSVETDPASFLSIDHDSVGHHYLQKIRRLAPAVAMAVDKNPQNLFNLPLILRALPHAKILCMQREPMDAAFSNLKELFQGGTYPYSYDLEDIAMHVQATRDWMEYWVRVAPHAVKVVSYEALVTDPDQILVGITDFLGIPRWEGLADIVDNPSPVATASSAQVREPLHRRNVGAWRRYARELEPLGLSREQAP